MKASIVFFFLLASSLARAADQPCLIAGDPNAPLTIEEFADLECPYCARGSALADEAVRAFPGKVKVVFRNLPLPFHAQAGAAAKAMSAVCRLSPGQAHAFQAAVFAHPRELARDGEAFLLKEAAKLGVGAIKAEMDGEGVAHDLARDRELAERNGFTATPSFLVGKRSVTGAVPFAELKKVIESEL